MRFVQLFGVYGGVISICPFLGCSNKTLKSFKGGHIANPVYTYCLPFQQTQVCFSTMILLFQSGICCVSLFSLTLIRTHLLFSFWGGSLWTKHRFKKDTGYTIKDQICESFTSGSGGPTTVDNPPDMYMDTPNCFIVVFLWVFWKLASTSREIT